MFQLPTTLMGRQPKAVNDCMCAWHCLSWEELTKQTEGRKENSSKETESKRGVVWISSTIQMSSLAGIVHACSKQLHNLISITQLKCSTSWNFKPHLYLIIIAGLWALSNSNQKSSYFTGKQTGRKAKKPNINTGYSPPCHKKIHFPFSRMSV